MAAPEEDEPPMLQENQDREDEDDPEMPVLRPVLPAGPLPLVMMLEMVAFKRRMVGVEAEVWVESVRAKLAQVRINSLRDFLRYMLVINRRLHNAGHKQLHQSTLSMMSREVVEMLWGPEEF
jgi:hypothetical protein